MKQSLVGALALLGALAACSGSTSPTSGDPTLPAGSRVTLRFVNAGFDAPVDVYVNSVLTTRAEAFDSGYTAYLQASSVPQTVAVKMSGGLVLASAQITFAVDTPYTVVSRNSDLLVLLDTVSTPAFGAPSFRFVQTGLANAVDVYWTTSPANLTDLTPVASNVVGGTSLPYVSFPAGPTRIIATLHEDLSRIVYDSGIHTVSAGEAWTIVLTAQWKDPPPMSLLKVGLWMKDRS